MLVIKKWVLRLSVLCNIMLLAHSVAEAKKKPIGLQEAITMALKENLDIRIAENSKKQSILSNRLATVCLWAPKATVMVAQDNRWEKETNFYIRSEPVFTLTWELKSLFNKIFQTKVHRQDNVVHNLTAIKAVEKELRQVVTCYYDLALAQKKWELSNTFIKVAAARLKLEEEKLRVGLVSKIDCLDAQLALKQAKLTLLEQQESLKGKRRSLNLKIGKPLDEETLVQSTISVQPIWDMTAVTKEKVVDLEVAIQEKKVAIAATKLTEAKAYPLSCLSISGSFYSDGYVYDLKSEQWDTKQSSKWLGGVGISFDIGALLLLPAETKKASIALNNEKLKLTQEKLAAEGNLENKKWSYRHALALHKVVEEKLKISKQKLVFVKEKYRLNQVKLLDLQEAEETVQKVEINLIEHAFKVKQTEFDLYRLVGMFHQ